MRTSSGGVKKRHSSLCARSVVSPTRPVVNKVGEESRKDIRKAVEAACKVTPRYDLTMFADLVFAYLYNLYKVEEISF